MMQTNLFLEAWYYIVPTAFGGFAPDPHRGAARGPRWELFVPITLLSHYTPRPTLFWIKPGANLIAYSTLVYESKQKGLTIGSQCLYQNYKLTMVVTSAIEPLINAVYHVSEQTYRPCHLVPSQTMATLPKSRPPWGTSTPLFMVWVQEVYRLSWSGPRVLGRAV